MSKEFREQPEDWKSLSTFLAACIFAIFCVLWWAWPALCGSQSLNRTTVTTVNKQDMASMFQTREDVVFAPVMGAGIGTFLLSTTNRKEIAGSWVVDQDKILRNMDVYVQKQGTVIGVMEVCLYGNSVSSFAPNTTTLGCAALRTCNLLGSGNPTATNFAFGTPISLTTNTTYWTVIRVQTSTHGSGNRLSAYICSTSKFSRVVMREALGTSWTAYQSTFRGLQLAPKGQP